MQAPHHYVHLSLTFSSFLLIFIFQYCEMSTPPSGETVRSSPPSTPGDISPEPTVTLRSRSGKQERNTYIFTLFLSSHLIFRLFLLIYFSTSFFSSHHYYRCKWQVCWQPGALTLGALAQLHTLKGARVNAAAVDSCFWHNKTFHRENHALPLPPTRHTTPPKKKRKKSLLERAP